MVGRNYGGEVAVDPVAPVLPVRIPDAEPSWWRHLHPVGRTRLVLGVLLAVTGPVLMAVLLTLPSGLGGLPTQTLLMLSVVVTTALVGGLLPAVAAALLGGVLLNLVFVAPVGRLTIADPEHAVAITLFLVIGVAVALVVDLAARRAEQAGRARAEADALTTLAQRLVASGDDLAELLREAVHLFGMSGAAVWRTGTGGAFTLESSWGDAPDPAAGSLRTPIDTDAVLVLAGPPLNAADQALLVAYAGHIRVIRDRARADRSAVEAAKLEQGNRTRTALLAAVSHDLRTPLAAIKAAAGSLRSTDVVWSDDERAELLATVEDAADRMSHLVGNLLDMTRLQTGAVTPLLADVDLEEVVDRAVRPLAEHERVITALPHDLPPVWVDAGLLERVVANLVENALRYASGRVRIEAAPIQHGDRRAGVALDVVDRGPGVSADRRPQLFQPFRRLGDVPQGDGLGLGLAVSHGLTEAMGGTLEARNTAGGGLTMRVWLPTATETP